MNHQIINTSVKSPRRWDIDWLRVIGTLFVFVFHAIQPFNPRDEWHLQNVEQSQFLGNINFILNFWLMPLFMLLAGASTWFALKKRTSGEYISERVTRILLPLVIGIMLIIPPQVYLERLLDGQFKGSFWQFYPHFFEGIYPVGNFSWHHLWFLVYLFIYSLLALPLFRLLQGDNGRQWVARLADLCQYRGGIFLFAVPLILGQVALRWRFPQSNALIDDWHWHWQLFLSFVYGYILVSEERFGRAISRVWPVALVLAVISTAIVFGLLVMNISREGPLFWAIYGVQGTLYRFGSWSWLIAILGLGQNFLNFKNRFLEYAGEAAYPFYILHQTVIVMVAFYVIQWDAGVFTKWLMVVSVALISTLGLYELVRRWNVTRFIVGLKPRQKTEVRFATTELKKGV